jgi:hypothetical protein
MPSLLAGETREERKGEERGGVIVCVYWCDERRGVIVCGERRGEEKRGKERR